MVENFDAYENVIQFADFLKKEIKTIKDARDELIKDPKYPYFTYFDSSAFYLLHSYILGIQEKSDKKELYRFEWLLNYPLLNAQWRRT